MRGMFKKITSLVMAGLLAVASLSFAPVSQAGAYGANNTNPYAMADAAPTGGEMMFDALMVRPIMAVGTVATTAVFLVSLPFSLLGGNVDEAAKRLVAEPFMYTFARPLGDD